MRGEGVCARCAKGFPHGCTHHQLQQPLYKQSKLLENADVCVNVPQSEYHWGRGGSTRQQSDMGAPDYPPRVAPQLPAQLPAAKGKMGENGGKWGEMGKPREIVGKLVEEHGKNIQLSTKVAKFWQTRYSPFSSISPDFSSGMLLNTPPPPEGQRKVVF